MNFTESDLEQMAERNPSARKALDELRARKRPGACAWSPLRINALEALGRFEDELMLGPERFDPPPSIRGAGVLPLSVTIPGPPHGKGRPRVVDGVAHTPKATKDWERHACSCFANAWGGMPHPGPLRVVVRSVKARRKTDPKTGGRFLSTVKPDLDNVVKAVLDAMERAGLFTGDQVVAMISASKWHAASWEGPCVEVEMMEAQG